MRLADLVFRGGHLSERVLIEAVMTGERPAHLERCDICAERAVDLGRWLDDVRTTGIESADAAFPAERLAAQQQQILRRLEQYDNPARVLSFPNPPMSMREGGGRRVAAGWVAVAAAAGLVIGVVSSQATQRLASRPAGTPAPAGTTASQPPAADQTPTDSTQVVASADIAKDPYLTEEVDRSVPMGLEAMAAATPRQMEARPTFVSLTTRKSSGGR